MSLETAECQRKFVSTKLSGRSEVWVLNLHRCHPFARKGRIKPTFGQVFWLPVRLRVLPSHLKRQWTENRIPGYSGGTATEFHRFPYSPTLATSRQAPVLDVSVSTRPQTSMFTAL